jgi:hypothetical protein
MMNSNEIPPLLDLSDIMHHMSPSPVPPEDPGTTTSTTVVPQINIARERGVSPERPSETDVLGFRRRLEEMGLWASRRPDGSQSQADANPDGITSSRESELLKMVGMGTCSVLKMVLTGFYLGFAAYRSATCRSYATRETGKHYRRIEDPAGFYCASSGGGARTVAFRA